jgi:hypothetical protein
MFMVVEAAIEAGLVHLNFGLSFIKLSTNITHTRVQKASVFVSKLIRP